ncbi:MAG: methyltransferase domain-containing protein [Bradymonadaceae bacterium]
MTTSDTRVQDFLQNYYGTHLQSGDDLKTNACCASGAPPRHVADVLSNVHDDVQSRFYGCGFPIPLALAGATVVDLGCGTGRDVYCLSQLVGPDGFVHGVDMTKEQLEVGRETLAWHMDKFGFEKPNVDFHKGFIEELGALPIEPGTVDLIVSNCVFNLSPRKDLVLEEVWKLLKPGGEFYFSDVFCDRRLPEDIASDPVLHAECLGGAMYINDFVALANKIGFAELRQITEAPITIHNDELEAMVGAAHFTSNTWRLFKLENLEPQCEDYGQVATYKGGIEGAEKLFWLDDHHAFEAGRPERVCGNTASMLEDTRLAPYFEVVGNRKVHYGLYPCEPTLAARTALESGDGSGGCC